MCSGAARAARGYSRRSVGHCEPHLPPVQSTGERRAVDPSIVAGSADRLTGEAGWRPMIDLQKSIDDFVAGEARPGNR